MPGPRNATEGRITVLTQHFAAEAVLARDVAAFPAPAVIAGLPIMEQRRLLDGLLTIRPPRPIEEDMADELDDMLAQESAERVADAGRPDALELPVLAQTHGVDGPVGQRVALWQGDLTTLRAGAIVNAANQEMLGCRVPGHACIDNMVHAVAGPGLRAECARYMARRASRGQGGEPVGSALVTGGYHLPAAHVIHTVGPEVSGAVGEADRASLASCYRAVLDAAQDLGLDSVGLCSVSTGAFGYPRQDAAQVSLKAVETWLQDHPDSAMRIVLGVYGREGLRAYEEALRGAGSARRRRA